MESRGTRFDEDTEKRKPLVSCVDGTVCRCRAIAGDIRDGGIDPNVIRAFLFDKVVLSKPFFASESFYCCSSNTSNKYIYIMYHLEIPHAHS